MSQSPRQIVYYKQARPGGRLRRRGVIDLPSASLMIKQYPWRGRRRPDRETGQRYPGSELLGFVDDDDSYLEFSSNDDGTFYVQFDHFRTKRFMRLVPYRRWIRRTARTETIKELILLTKLFFNGRHAVIDDLLAAASNLEDDHSPTGDEADTARPDEQAMPTLVGSGIEMTP